MERKKDKKTQRKSKKEEEEEEDNGAGVFPRDFYQAKLRDVVERELEMKNILKITMNMKPHLTHGGGYQ